LAEIISAVDLAGHGVDLEGQQITDQMRELRASSLQVRKQRYVDGRIQRQIRWYSSRAAANEKAARFWNWVLAILEVCALLLGIGRLQNLTRADLTGILVTCSAGGLAWLQSRQHVVLAQSYAVTAHELANVEATLGQRATEAEWATKVEQAEEAISREHTLWLASRR
jgi:hypothetical protein